MEKIIELAKQRGSSATTHAGAWRYLLAHLPTPLPIPDSSGEWKSREKNYDRRADSYSVTQWRADRELAQAKKWCAALGFTPEEDVREFLEKKYRLNDLKRELRDHWPLKQSQSKWAGGAHSVSINLADFSAPHTVGANGGSTREWSANGKWSGNDSFARLTVTERALQAFPTLRARGSEIILDAELVEPRIYKIKTVKNGRGFELAVIDAWLIRDFCSTRKNLTAAKKEAMDARARSLSTAIAKRSARHEFRREYSATWVSAEDSLRGGNCEIETRRMEARIQSLLGGPVGAVRADYLLSVRDDVFTRRAVSAAQQRAHAIAA